MSKSYQIGWFSTARGKGSRDLLTAAYNSIQGGETKAKIAFVFCSREPGESAETDLFLKLVDSYSLPLVSFSCARFRAQHASRPALVPGTLPEWRREYDREVMKRLDKFAPEINVLAGYMLIVGPEMCRKYDMVNLHPAAPGGPKGTWQEVIWQLIDRGATETGAMMHLVTPELDRGPVVTYCTFSIRGGAFDRYRQEIAGEPVEQVKRREGENNALFRLIRARGLAREFPLIIYTIKAFSEGQVRISPDKQVINTDGRSINGYDLSGVINRKVGRD